MKGIILHKKNLFVAIGVIGTLAALTGCTAPAAEDDPTTALDCDPATVAALDDDSQRSAFYAMENGIVTSDSIPSVEINYLAIPALIQASGTGQFNYTQTSLNGVVLARENGGLDLRVVAYALAHSGGGLAIYTKEGSGIESAADLAGHTLATPSFGSTATVEAQLVLADKYDIDAALEGGAVSWVELDPPTTLNALKSGDIDAALMWHQGGWLAENDPEIAQIAKFDVDFKEIANGAWPIGAAVVAQGDFVDANLECVNEFQRMYAESVAYAEENHADFADEISEVSGVSVDFINYWWDDSHYMYGGVVDDEWLGYADEFYKLAFDHGFIPVYPDVNEISVIPGS